MLDDMYTVMERINEIRNKFHLKRHNAEQNTENKGFNETLQREIENISCKGEISSIDRVKEISHEYTANKGVPSSLVNAVIETESSFNPFAVSKKGAKGLMQLMPGVLNALGVSNPFDIRENVKGGISILGRLLKKYNGDYVKTLAAYNAGETAVDKNGGVPQYRETREYVKKVINAYMKNAKL